MKFPCFSHFVLSFTSLSPSLCCSTGDLWGPLIFCLMLAISLSFGSTDEDAALIFTAVFVTVWVGAAVVTVNTALLGGNMCVPSV